MYSEDGVRHGGKDAQGSLPLTVNRLCLERKRRSLICQDVVGRAPLMQFFFFQNFLYADEREGLESTVCALVKENATALTFEVDFNAIELL